MWFWSKADHFNPQRWAFRSYGPRRRCQIGPHRSLRAKNQKWNDRSRRGRQDQGGDRSRYDCPRLFVISVFDIKSSPLSKLWGGSARIFRRGVCSCPYRGTCTVDQQAFGSSVSATSDLAQETHSNIREWLSTHVYPKVAETTRILYGGSVNAKNSADLIAQKDIDGFLVGGATLARGSSSKSTNECIVSSATTASLTVGSKAKDNSYCSIAKTSLVQKFNKLKVASGLIYIDIQC